VRSAPADLLLTAPQVESISPMGFQDGLMSSVELGLPIEFDVDVATRLRGAPMHYVMAVNYLNGARHQLVRIRDTKERLRGIEARLPRMTDDEQREAVLSLPNEFVDTHFYLVAVDKAVKLLGALVRAEDDVVLAAIWSKHRSGFKSFVDARNHLEHIDERVDRFGPDLGRFEGEDWVLQESRYSVGIDGFARVLDAFEEICDEVRSRPLP
jgi:hypothetical protein